MSEAIRIAQLYRKVYEGDGTGEAWHGPALKPLLQDVSADQASGSQGPGQHSILQLVLHIAYWEEIELRRFPRRSRHCPAEYARRLAKQS